MTLESLAWLLPPALVARLPARGQLRDLFVLLGGNLVKIALGLVTSSIVFRTLGPDNAGRLTLALSIVGLLSIIGEFGLRDAAVNFIARFAADKPEDAYAVGRTFLVCRVFLSAIASSVGIFGGGLVAAQFYPGARVGDLVQLGAVSLFSSGLLAFSFVIFEAERKFSTISLLNSVQAIVRASLVLALFFAQGISLTSLLLLETIVPLIAFLFSLRIIPRSFLSLRRPFFAYFTSLFHFTKWIAVAALASAILMKLDVLMLSYYRSPSEVGLYAVALALVSRLDILKNAVLTASFPDACRQASPSDLRGFVRQSLKLTALVSVALTPLFALAQILIEWLYGVEYAAAIPVFSILVVGFIINLNAAPVAFVLYPLNRPRWIAASDLLQLLFAAGGSLVLIPPFGILGASFAVVLTRLFAALLTLFLVRRFLWATGTLT